MTIPARPVLIGRFLPLFRGLGHRLRLGCLRILVIPGALVIGIPPPAVPVFLSSIPFRAPYLPMPSALTFPFVLRTFAI